MTRRFVYDLWAEWDEDRDPGLIRMREALATRPELEPIEAARLADALTRSDSPQPPQNGPGAAEAVQVESTPAPRPPNRPDESTGRNRISELVARVQSGDLGAIDELRRLVDG